MELAPPIDLQVRDKVFTEECLGAHMLYLMVQEASKEKRLEIRADFLQQLNIASAAPLGSLDEISISRIARKTDEAASTLLRDLDRRDFLDGVYAVAMFNLVLVERGFDADARRIPVCLSLLLLEDVKNTDVDTEGASALMDVRETAWKDAANKMVLRAQLMGLYLPQTVTYRARMFAARRAAAAAKREKLMSERPRRAKGHALRKQGSGV